MTPIYKPGDIIVIYVDGGMDRYLVKRVETVGDKLCYWVILLRDEACEK